jgi:thymidylate synthase
MTEYDLRYPDSQYRDLLHRIFTQGIRVPTRQGPEAITLMQQTLTYDLFNGFPIITERDISSFWRKAIGELCAFINGATTLEELERFGCDWWGPWATKEKSAKIQASQGNLGSGSYGGAFHNFPGQCCSHCDEQEVFDQFQHLIEQIIELPDLRTHFITPWIPQANVRGSGKQPWTTISPCHGWVHVRIINAKIHLHMFQRSGDVPVGIPSNMVQYSALMLMLEQLTGFKAKTYYHTISDAHIYEDQIPAVRMLLDRSPKRLPTLSLTEDGKQITDIHDFRADHFDLIDYFPHPATKRIPVAV